MPEVVAVMSVGYPETNFIEGVVKGNLETCAAWIQDSSQSLVF